VVWSAFESQPELAELASFAKLLLKVVVNQAGCERVFSDLKVKQTQRCNRLGLNKLAKMTKVSVNSIDCTAVTPSPSFCQIGSDIKAEHQSLGLAKSRGKLKVHTSTNTLLAVPRYSDLLDDQDHEDEAERG
jgi:chromosome condensin MukBEF MukE localization factor